MNKYGLTILTILTVSMLFCGNAIACDTYGFDNYDSCKLKPDFKSKKGHDNNETFCELFVENGKVVVLVGAYITAVPYLNGHQMTVEEFNSVDKVEDSVFVEGAFDNKSCIVKISKFDDFKKKD